jgi:hypothetical protein
MRERLNISDLIIGLKGDVTRLAIGDLAGGEVTDCACPEAGSILDDVVVDTNLERTDSPQKALSDSNTTK